MRLSESVGMTLWPKGKREEEREECDRRYKLTNGKEDDKGEDGEAIDWVTVIHLYRSWVFRFPGNLLSEGWVLRVRYISLSLPTDPPRSMTTHSAILLPSFIRLMCFWIPFRTFLTQQICTSAQSPPERMNYPLTPNFPGYRK